MLLSQSSHLLRPAFLRSNTPQRASSSKWPNIFCCTEAAVVNGFEFQRPSVDILLEERVWNLFHSNTSCHQLYMANRRIARSLLSISSASHCKYCEFNELANREIPHTARVVRPAKRKWHSKHHCVWLVVSFCTFYLAKGQFWERARLAVLLRALFVLLEGSIYSF